MIGVGLMGHGIATNLLRHGHALTVLEHPGNQPLDALLAAGARTASTPAQVAAASQVVILVVTGSPQVESVVLGEAGLLQGIRPGTVVIDCSTALPLSTVKVAAQVEKAGGQFLDAPMTRTPKEAAEGRLNLLVGGDEALFARYRPLLACFAENITHVGAVGNGHRMKLLHNYVSLGSVALIAEAAAHARNTGVDAATFVEVLAAGGGGGVALERLRGFLLTGDPSGLKFSIANALKDLSYYNEMAGQAGVERGIAGAVMQTLAQVPAQQAAASLVPQLVDQMAGRRDPRP